ncbi:hypothetical protein AB6A40_000300 [Gnathostoma spinigerum]|uniref:SAC3/GANP/THP3 conserved domain-containing protein n=1 Tax=Gnathostoma spinigerum TaxID=75299 RepID=A0ABD6E3V1_9BILA
MHIITKCIISNYNLCYILLKLYNLQNLNRLSKSDGSDSESYYDSCQSRLGSNRKLFKMTSTFSFNIPESLSKRSRSSSHSPEPTSQSRTSSEDLRSLRSLHFTSSQGKPILLNTGSKNRLTSKLALHRKERSFHQEMIERERKRLLYKDYDDPKTTTSKVAILKHSHPQRTAAGRSLMNRRSSLGKITRSLRRRSSEKTASGSAKSDGLRRDTMIFKSSPKKNTFAGRVNDSKNGRQVVKKDATESVKTGDSTVEVMKKVDHNAAETSRIPSFSQKQEVANQLSQLFGRICRSTVEMYQTLDERDKLLNSIRVKSSDVENATVVQGTCLDMCPEKERYFRDIQKRIHPYECDVHGKMIAQFTVKEYSRSAADQEEPLPHELRPVNVLQTTMNYLIGKICGNIPPRSEEENLAQWYDFIWNRTRAVRKDLTQQMIVNETAVRLIEQCARLHIFAAHHLCELGFNEFDQRMNTENLTKCLQSLRHLYEDLGKRGVYCPNEAEFRAYDVLLSLTDSNILREVLSYRRVIRESTEIRLALRLFNCVQSSNYVRFFRLLKTSATFLQACLCHRYFSHMRGRALSNMVSSYGPVNKYPTEKYAELLGYNDKKHAMKDVEVYGVSVSDNDTSFFFSKMKYTEPEEESSAGFSAWVDQKRDGQKLAEILYGERVPSVDIRPVTVSFNSTGVYENDAVILGFLDEVRQTATKGYTNFSVQPSHIGKKASDLLSSSISSIESRVKNELIEEVFARFIEKSLRRVQLHQIIEEVTTNLAENLICLWTRSFAQEMLMSAKLLNRQRMIMMTHGIQKRSSEKLERLVCDEIVSHLFNELSGAVIKSVEKIKKKKHIERVINAVIMSSTATLVTDITEELVSSVAVSVMKKNVTDVKNHLGAIVDRLDRLWLRQFTDRWLGRIRARRCEHDRKVDILQRFPVVLTGRLVPHMTIATRSRTNRFDKKTVVTDEKSEFTKCYQSVRRAFNHWRHWTRKRIELKHFFLGFTPRSLSPFKKRARLTVTCHNDFANWQRSTPTNISSSLVEIENQGPLRNELWNQLDDRTFSVIHWNNQESTKYCRTAADKIDTHFQQENVGAGKPEILRLLPADVQVDELSGQIASFAKMVEEALMEAETNNCLYDKILSDEA